MHSVGKYIDLLRDVKVEGESAVLAVSDATGVASIPPIINSARTAIGKTTSNVFVEATAVDFHKAHVFVQQVSFRLPSVGGWGGDATAFALGMCRL